MLLQCEAKRVGRKDRGQSHRIVPVVFILVPVTMINAEVASRDVLTQMALSAKYLLMEGIAKCTVFALHLPHSSGFLHVHS